MKTMHKLAGSFARTMDGEIVFIVGYVLVMLTYV
jgi:hypothetical protein